MAKRRTAGEGTICQLPSGSWRAQVSLKGRRLSHTSKTQQSAREWIRKIQDQIDQGLTYDDERTTVGSFLKGWMATKKSQVKTSTFDSYALSNRIYLQPYLGSIKLKDLTPARVQNFFDDLVQAGRGLRSIQLARILLLGCMEHAKNLGLIARNPVEYCKVPKTPDIKLKVWSEEQVARFLISIHGHRNEFLYYLALVTGMRRGELLGLKWEDVDWSRQRIMISRQVYNPDGGGFIFQEPKTRRGIRSIRLGSGAIDKLRKQLANIDMMRRISREKWQEYDLVFPKMTGMPQNSDHLTREFLALVRASGLPRIRLHDCRHTAATIMLNHGIPPVIVAGMLGHSLAILMNIYTHFIPDMQDGAAQLMDEVTSPIEIDLHIG